MVSVGYPGVAETRYSSTVYKERTVFLFLP